MARLPEFLNISAAGRVRLALPTARLAIIAFSFTLAAVGMGAFVATLPSASAVDAAIDGAAASPDAAGDDAQRPDPTLQDDAAQDVAPAEGGDAASGGPSASGGSYSAPGGTLVAPVSSGSGAATPSGTSSSSGAAVDYVLAREARLAGPRAYTPASSALADPAPGEKDLPREHPVPSLGLLRVAGGYVTGSIWWVDPAGEGCVVGSLAHRHGRPHRRAGGRLLPPPARLARRGRLVGHGPEVHQRQLAYPGVRRARAAGARRQARGGAGRRARAGRHHGLRPGGGAAELAWRRPMPSIAAAAHLTKGPALANLGAQRKREGSITC